MYKWCELTTSSHVEDFQSMMAVKPSWWKKDFENYLDAEDINEDSMKLSKFYKLTKVYETALNLFKCLQTNMQDEFVKKVSELYDFPTKNDILNIIDQLANPDFYKGDYY